MSDQHKVSIVRCKDYESETIYFAIKNALEHLGGIQKFVKKGDKVLIKPNVLTDKTPEQMVTTHPEVVYTVCTLVKKAGGIPYVGDSPAFSSSQKAYKKTGIYDAATKAEAELVEFKGKTFPSKKGKVTKSFFLDENLFEYDVIINLPKLKTHIFTEYTGAVKNLFGLVVGMEKSKYHVRFGDKIIFTEMLFDLYQKIKPQLTIMDAVYGMEGDGPAAGEPRKVGLILASDDALSLDLVALKIINMENTPLQIVAEKRGVEPEIEVYGDLIKNVAILDFKKPSSKPNTLSVLGKTAALAKKILIMVPAVDKKACDGCSTCYQMCPAEPKAIEMKREKDGFYPKFDYSKCIRCYCCHETCPRKAIYLKRKIF